MASDELRFAIDMMRAGIEANGRPVLSSPAEARAQMVQMMATLATPEGVSYEPVLAGGVPAEWTVPNGEHSGTVLYLHGGGYFQGSVQTHRRLVGALCNAAGVRALSVDYRLAPENPYPAAVDDAVAAYRWLVGDGGESPSHVVISGDSAGGGLSLATLVGLRDAGEPLPAGAYLLSPWTALDTSGDSWRTRAEVDPMISASGLETAIGWYVGAGDRRAPLVSPLYADLVGLPPMLVQVGDAEVLLDDSTRLVERAVAAGVDATVEVWPEAFHVFQAAAGLVPEADEALAKAGVWIRERLS